MTFLERSLATLAFLSYRLTIRFGIKIPGLGARWSRDRSRNILSDENLARLRGAFGEDGLVFGYHCFLAGGRNAEEVVYSNFDECMSAIREATPGDHFTLYSLKDVGTFEIARYGSAQSQKPLGLSDKELAPVQSFLESNRWNEVLIVSRRLDPKTGNQACMIESLWDPDEMEWHEAIETWSVLTGELIFIDQPKLDVGSFALHPNALLDAKVPTRQGRTPESGPY